MKRFLPLPLFFALLMPVVVHAQGLTFQDACATYQHQTALLSAVATPTQKMLSSSAQTQIYVCALHISQNVAGATPAITFYYGSGATCGTGTTTIGVYGSGTAGNTVNVIDGNGGTIMLAPNGNNLCVVENTTAIPQGSIEYVQK